MKLFLKSFLSLMMISTPIMATISCTKKTKNLSSEILKFQNFITHAAANKSDNDLSQETQGADITTKFKNIIEVKASLIEGVFGDNKLLNARLSKDVGLHKVVVKEAYDIISRKLIIAITLVDNLNDKVSDSKNIIITFNKLIRGLTTEITKLQNFTTIDPANKIENNFINEPYGADVTSKFKAIFEVKNALENNVYGPNKPLNAVFLNDIFIANVQIKKRYSHSTQQLEVIITLNNSTGLSDIKNIIITFNKLSKDLELEIAKLQNFTTIDPVNKDTNNFLNDKANANVTTKFNKILEMDSIINNKLVPGNYKPLSDNFSPGISIGSVTIKTPYNFSTKKLEVTITLNDFENPNIINNTKDITIVFNTLVKDFSSDIAKLQNFTTIDAIDKVGNVFSEDDGHEELTLKFKAISEVNAALENSIYGNDKPLSAAFSSGVLLDKVHVKDYYDPSTKKMVVIVFLKYDSKDSIEYKLENYHKDITITFS